MRVPPTVVNKGIDLLAVGEPLDAPHDQQVVAARMHILHRSFQPGARSIQQGYASGTVRKGNPGKLVRVEPGEPRRHGFLPGAQYIDGKANIALEHRRRVCAQRHCKYDQRGMQADGCK